MFATVGKDLVLRLRVGPVSLAINPATLGASLGLSFLLLALGLWLRRGIPKDPEAAPPRRIVFLLALMDFAENQVLGGVSEKLRRALLPVIATLFLYVLPCNLSSVLPIPGMVAPTQDLNVTLGLALLVYTLTHVYGVRTKGAFRHVRGYLEPLPMMLPLNIIGDMGRTLSHGFRLFGNILGGAIMLAVAIPVLLQFMRSPFFTGLFAFILVFMGFVLRRWKKTLGMITLSLGGVLLLLTALEFVFSGVGMARFGLGALMVGSVASFFLNAFFGIFAGTIQALVFTLLAAAYIQVAVE